MEVKLGKFEGIYGSAKSNGRPRGLTAEIPSATPATKPSVYSLKDLVGIIRKNKFDVVQILSEMEGEDSLPFVYETNKTCDLSYAGTLFIAKQKGIKAEVVLVQKASARFVSVARAQNPTTNVTQFGAASYPITIRFSDEVIKHIVGRLALRNAIKKVVPHQEVLAFIYKTKCET